MSKIILIGPPGSGKSTQCELLSSKLSIPFISVGAILREVAKGTSEMSKLVSRYVSQGDLVPDEDILPILHEYITKPELQNGYIIDGFPRNLDQAKKFTEKIDVVISILLDDNEAIRRIHGRHDARNDATDATIKHRMDIFHTQTDDVIEYYRSLGILVEVDGKPSVEEIHKEICSKLGI